MIFWNDNESTKGNRRKQYETRALMEAYTRIHENPAMWKDVDNSVAVSVQVVKRLAPVLNVSQFAALEIVLTMRKTDYLSLKEKLDRGKPSVQSVIGFSELMPLKLARVLRRNIEDYDAEINALWADGKYRAAKAQKCWLWASTIWTVVWRPVSVAFLMVIERVKSG